MPHACSRAANNKASLLAFPAEGDRPNELARTMAPHPLIYQELPYNPKYTIWVVVVINIISLVMNAITPSKQERAIWMPVALILTICSSIVALN